MPFPNVADLSSAQREFDFRKYAQSGRQAIIIKSTESVGYHFSVGDGWEQEALSLGLSVGRYHFAGDSNNGFLRPATVEAEYFLEMTGLHGPGRFAVCDFENPLHGPSLYGLSPKDAANWVGQFLDYVASHGSWPGMGYAFEGSGVVQRLKSPYLRWYAAYPGPVPADAALHQFSSGAYVPGVGTCDDSLCYVDLHQFAKGFPPPPPPPSNRLAKIVGGNPSRKVS